METIFRPKSSPRPGSMGGRWTSSGLALAGKLSGTRILENLNGTDFTPKVLARAEEHGWTVYLLGAEERIVERCKERLSVRYPRLAITGYHHGHFSAGENRAIIEEINRNAPDILLVALGRSEEHTSELQSHSFISYAV